MLHPKWISLGLQLARVPLDVISTGIRVSEELIVRTIRSSGCERRGCGSPSSHYCAGCQRRYCCEDFDHQFGACLQCRNEAAEAAAREAQTSSEAPQEEEGEDEGRGSDTVNRIRFPYGDSLN